MTGNPPDDDHQGYDESSDLLSRTISSYIATERRGKARTIDDPTQMVIVNSILFFIAIQTDVTCSAALATMGRRIRPMNALGMWYRSAVSSIDATKKSAQKEVMTVTTRRLGRPLNTVDN